MTTYSDPVASLFAEEPRGVPIEVLVEFPLRKYGGGSLDGREGPSGEERGSRRGMDVRDHVAVGSDDPTLGTEGCKGGKEARAGATDSAAELPAVLPAVPLSDREHETSSTTGGDPRGGVGDGGGWDDIDGDYAHQCPVTDPTL